MKSSEKTRRPKASSYRLGQDTLGLIDRLARHLRGPGNLPYSASAVLRLAIERLAEAELPRREKKL